MTLPDFTPTAAPISLHGLGLLQIKMTENSRLHIWHPDLPRRKCFEHSSIHNHRFSFKSTVLKGTQISRRCYVYPMESFGGQPSGASHALISHNGPRSEKGGRESYVAGYAKVSIGDREYYTPGESYFMQELEYHCTPCEGIVVTHMVKLTEGDTHAHSTIEIGHDFEFDFDRFQWPESRLWEIAQQALTA